ncbi:hypothetical protein INT44_000575 [Umbelopsis vinacea]|uniref:Tetratricopeptide repeat protein n=1 Tax=Umbelopsis vinacea TaxID=44442 RepID=A0A8H7PLH1_9FUNG|nr:hypothetical protein INT44_000575 [Umbelopsis vinacea]
MSEQSAHYLLTISEIPAFDSVWELSDNSEIEKAFDEILQHKLSDDIAAQVLTQLARSQELQGKFDFAMETLETSRQISNDVIPHIRYLLEYGRVLRSSGKSDDAVPYFKKAYEAAVGLEDFYAADAAHMLGILDPTAGPIKGRTWSEEALAIARKSTHPPSQRWAAIILNNTAWDSFDQGDYQTALELFNEATELRRMAVEHNKTQKTKESYRIARWSVAYTLRHTNRLEDAYTIQKQLLSEGNTKSNREELRILANKLGYTNEAEEHKKALEEMEAK